MLAAGWRRRAELGAYPAALAAAGWVVALAMAGLGGYTLVTQIPPLFR
jgi:hypothetical protein